MNALRRFLTCAFPRRVPPRLYLTYLLVLVFTFAFLWSKPPPRHLPKGRTVEALAPLAPPAHGLVFLRWRPSRAYLRGILAYQIPYLSGGGASDPLALELDAVGRLSDWFTKETTGVEVANPASFLRAQLPFLPSPVLHPTSSPASVPPIRLGQAQTDRPVQALPPAVAARGPAPQAYHNPSNARVPYPYPPPPDLYGQNPLVAIYHTDSQESFLPALSKNGKLAPNRAYSPDQAVSIVQVGTWLAEDLWQTDHVPVAHSLAVNDPLGVIGSYENSGVTAAALLKSHPGIRLLLDLHRGDFPLRTSLFQWHGRKVARIMLVVGTAARLPDPNWRVNLAVAKVLAQRMQASFPGLLIGIYPSPNSYNQQLSPGALLVDIGGPYNTLSQEKRSAALLAQVLARVLADPNVP